MTVGSAFALDVRQIEAMTAHAFDSGDLESLRLRALWSAFKREGLSFWLLCAYLMFEYVRPQSIYESLDFFPWTSTTMMATAVAAFASRQTRRVSTPANGLLLLYSLVLVLSSINAYRPARSYAGFDIYFLWLLAYALIIHIVTTERRMLMFVLAFVLFNLKMSLFATRHWVSIGFSFSSWGVGGAPGWFRNSGEFGIEMCVFFPIVTYLAVGLRPHLPRWKFLGLLGVAGTALAGMIASSSRGALLGGAAVVLFMLVRSKYKMRALFAGIIVAAVFILAIPPQQKQRLSESGEDKTSLSRLAYWKHGIEMTNDHPVLGIGYNNWIEYYQDHFGWGGFSKAVAHNIFIQAASELGYAGLLSFLLLVGCTFVLNSRSRALATRAGPAGLLTYCLANGLDAALVGFLVSGFFISALYYPYLWINLAMTVALNTVAGRLPVSARAGLTSHIGDRLRLASAIDVPLDAAALRSSLPRR